MTAKAHVFTSTRKGVPLGQRADFSKCDRCGGRPGEPQHVTTDEEFADSLVAALEAHDDPA